MYHAAFSLYRTQLSLETWQVEALRSQAGRAGISISELVRRILTEHLSPTPGATDENPLLAMEGMFEDTAAGRDHDAFLYGAKKPE